MDPVAKTVELFTDGGLNCSQAILTVFGEKFGIDPEMARNLGRGYGGGMGRQAMTCGALTGAVMVCGLAFDRASESDAKNAAYKAVRQLFAQFKQRHGTTECVGLLGAHVGTKEGMKKIEAEKLVQKVCPTFVGDTARILSRILEETGKRYEQT